jgi:protein disulfide-isomerase A1
MRTFATFAVGLLGAAVASASDVTSLTKDTFTDFVTENDLVLAECKLPTPLTTLGVTDWSIL